MKNLSPTRTIAAAMLVASVCITAPTAALADKDRDAMERARVQVEQAREELRKATRELARSMAHAEKDNPRAQYFEFMTNPDRPVIGIIIGDPKEENTSKDGIRILAITPGGGAEKAGLEAGDVIVSMDGQSMAAANGKHPEDLLRKHMHKRKAGDEMKVEYVRGSKKHKATIKTQAPEPDFAMSMMPPLPPEALLNMDNEDYKFFVPPFAKMFSSKNSATRGLELSKLDDDLAGYFKTKDGVLVIRAPKDDALGLKSGDVILKIDGTKVGEPLTVMDKLRGRGDERSVKIEIMRMGKTKTLHSKIPVADARQHTGSRHLQIIVDHDHDDDHEDD